MCVNHTNTHYMMGILVHIDTGLKFVYKQNTFQLQAAHAQTLDHTLSLHQLLQRHEYCTLVYKEELFCKG
jgi:hypothetical protein